MLEKLPLVNTNNIMVLGVKKNRKLTPQQRANNGYIGKKRENLS